ncbi:MAG: hypothetical protein E7458_04210 [Ruminococcaceae bacterium]|nr:hypothetical protein [Oscillospiraceae bacterium]
MNLKRLLALLLAVLMMVTLFSACASDKEDDKKDDTAATDKTDDKAEDKKDDEAELDIPDESEKLAIEWMGSQGATTHSTGEEAATGEYETYMELMRIITEEYNLDYTYTIIYSDAYLTTLNGFIAADTLPDMFNTREVLTDTTLNQLINNGGLASVDEILEYSDAAKVFYNDGDKLLYLKAFATVEDGNWYYVPLPNTTGSSFDFSTDKYVTRANGQIHGAYSVCVRQDWLDKCGLAMPTNTDEFYQALETFQNEDVNGSGAKEERYMGLIGNNFQTCGVGQWYGLPYTDFIEDPATGVIEVSCLTDGFAEYCEYMNTLYDNNMVYIEGNHPWGSATEIGANEIAALGMMPGNLQFWSTGEPLGYYMPMPIVSAVEGIEGRLLVQESQAAFVGFSFSTDVDYAAAGRMMDFLVDQDVYMVFKHGIEGVAWDWNEDKTGLITYTLTEEELPRFGAAQTYWCSNNCFPINGGHHGNLWAVPQIVYDDAALAVEEEAYYKQDNMTREMWQEQRAALGFPEDLISAAEQMLIYVAEAENNYHPTAYYSYTTMATNEEAEIIAKYETDLKTYLVELCTNIVVGTETTDTLDEKVQHAKDNLGLVEYYNVMQTRVNRYLEAIGREAAPLMD